MMGGRIEVFSMRKWKRILSVLLLLAAVLTCFSPICEAESLDCGAKLLAITFDDGPGPYTAGLLDELAARGVRMIAPVWNYENAFAGSCVTGGGLNDTQKKENALKNELIEQGCQIIFGNSFGYQEYFKEAAEEHPEVIFSHCSGYMCNDTNFNNYWGAIYQARYLSGIVAGLKTKANLIGYVGSMNNPEVNGGLNAFALGVKSVNPDAKIYVKYTGTWYDVTLEKQTAEALLDLGCDVLGQHCDTSMPMVAAEERGAYGIGYNAVISEGEPGYKAWMTAPVWDWSAVLVSEVQSVIDGTWKPENVFFGLKEGLVSLAPLTDAAPAGAQELIDAATAKMVSGEWDVFTGPITDNQGNVVIAEGETVHYNANFGSAMTWLLDTIEAR